MLHTRFFIITEIAPFLPWHKKTCLITNIGSHRFIDGNLYELSTPIDRQMSLLLEPKLELAQLRV
jgi:hypothetical protein